MCDKISHATEQGVAVSLRTVQLSVNLGFAAPLHEMPPAVEHGVSCDDAAKHELIDSCTARLPDKRPQLQLLTQYN